MQIYLDNTIPVLDAIEEQENLEDLGFPIPALFDRANSFFNPLGELPARGWFLLESDILVNLDLNGFHSIRLVDDAGNFVKLNNLLVASEPQAVTGGDPGDPNTVYLLELADQRHLLAAEALGVACWRQYNVRAPGYAFHFLLGSLNFLGTSSCTLTLGSTSVTGGLAGVAAGDQLSGTGLLVGTDVLSTSGGGAFTATVAAVATGASTISFYRPWTWLQLVQDLWGLMTSWLGPIPTALPFSPDGIPEGWIFPGMNAWTALSQVLNRIGCAVRFDPTANTNQYSIVRIGSSTTAGAAAITRLLIAAAGRLCYDAQFLGGALYGRIPGSVTTYFHRQELDSGTEQSTTDGANNWLSNAYASVTTLGSSITTAANFADPGIIHALWDDLPALFDATGTLTNLTALGTRAAERTADYYRGLLYPGGERLDQTYQGIVKVQPGETLKSVTWRQDQAGIGGDGLGGLVTDVVRHPYPVLPIDRPGGHGGGGCDDCLTSTQVRVPDFGPMYPITVERKQMVRVKRKTPSGITTTADSARRWPGKVQRIIPGYLIPYTTLTTPITSGDTSITTTVPFSGLTLPFGITIDDEQLLATSGTNPYGVTRAQNGTTAAAHPNGVTVTPYPYTDAEDCQVYDANGATLTPGEVYEGRLSGTTGGLPLYQVTADGSTGALIARISASGSIGIIGVGPTTTLTADLLNGDTTMTVADTTIFPTATLWFCIDGHIVAGTVATSTTVTITAWPNGTETSGTTVQAGSNVYGWVEQAMIADGVWKSKPGGRFSSDSNGCVFGAPDLAMNVLTNNTTSADGLVRLTPIAGSPLWLAEPICSASYYSSGFLTQTGTQNIGGLKNFKQGLLEFEGTTGSNIGTHIQIGFSAQTGFQQFGVSAGSLVVGTMGAIAGTDCGTICATANGGVAIIVCGLVGDSGSRFRCLGNDGLTGAITTGEVFTGGIWTGANGSPPDVTFHNVTVTNTSSYGGMITSNGGITDNFGVVFNGAVNFFKKGSLSSDGGSFADR